MLRFMRQGQRWVLWFVIIVVGGVFVLYLGLGGAFAPGLPGGIVVQVEGRAYTARDVDRERQAQEASYRRTLGEDFDAAAVAEYLDESAARSLMQRGMLAREAEALGLRVSDREIRDYLRNIPGAADERGRLDRDVLTGYAEREFGSLRRFQEALRDELLASKARRLLQESVSVSEAETREALRYTQEEAEIAYVALDPTQFAEVEAPDEQVQALLADSPEAVRAAYEERRDEFDLPERRRARHVLIRAAEDAAEADVEAARERAEAARERILAGEDFEAVALELSEDPGSQVRGGDLGVFPRGAMVPPFEEAAFSLEPGSVSEPVRTSFGWHVIRVDEALEAESRSFEEVRDEIARDLVKRELGSAAARALAETLQTEIRAGKSLTEAAREADLALERPDPLRRRPDGLIPGLGAAPALLTAAFALPRDAEQPSSDRIFDVGGRLILIQRLALRTPSDEELAPEVAQTREALIARRRTSALQQWLTQRQADLSEAGQLRLDLAALRGES